MSPAEEIRIFRTLVESAGWKALKEIADAQIRGRVDEVVLTPLPKLDEAPKQEFMKGEISGIKLFLAIPEAQIAVLQAHGADDPPDISEEKLNDDFKPD